MRGRDKMKNRYRELKRNFYINNKANLVLSIVCLIIKAVLQVIFAFWVQNLFDLAVKGDISRLIKLVYLIIGYFIFVVLNDLFLKEVKNKFLKNAMFQYKDFVFKEIISKKIFEYKKRDSSQYLSMMINDTMIIEKNYLQGMLQIIYNITMLVAALFMMICYNIWLFMIAILCSLVPIVIAYFLGDKLVRLEKGVSYNNEKFMARIKNLLDGFTVLKSFNAEKEVEKMFHDENLELENVMFLRKKANDLINLTIFNSATIFHMILFVVGVFLTINGDISLGVLTAFVQLMNYVLNPVEDLSLFLANFKSADALIKKMADCIEVQENQNDCVDITSLTNGIQIKNLTFGYEKDKTILKNINSVFELGKSYAIIGGSGSGKSTLLNLIMGNYHQYTGEIRIGNYDLKEISNESLYNVISIIEQNVFVFDSSIIDNITMFKPFKKEEIDYVIEKAGLSSLIEHKGYDYQCGENGKNLSGGEKQRISIARALLKQTQILLLDEATSALDSQTTFEIEKTILNLANVSKIVITHKMSENILKIYDEVIVLSHGEIVEKGGYYELMKKKGHLYFLSILS